METESRAVSAGVGGGCPRKVVLRSQNASSSVEEEDSAGPSGGRAAVGV